MVLASIQLCSGNGRERSGQFRKKGMVQLGGVEPPTSGSTIQRSNQLSYSCAGGKLGLQPPKSKQSWRSQAL
jgi:hypothetical protein